MGFFKRMLRLIRLGILLTIVSIHYVSAGAPTLMNFQGRLADLSGSPIQGTYSMIFRLYTVESGGTYDWQEIFTGANGVTSNQNGVFTVILNSTGGATGDLASVITSSTDLWIEIQVEGDILSPRQRIRSVAYAISSPWPGLTGVPSGIGDGIDDVPSAGIGLDELSGQLSLEPESRLPQDAADTQVAKWNQTTGIWEKGDDLNAFITAGDGLMMTGSEMSVVFSGSGTTGDASRSDHTHYNQAWSGALSPGLEVISSGTTPGSPAIKGTASGSDATIGLAGETTASSGGASGVFGLASGSTGITRGVCGQTNSNTTGSSGVKGYAAGPAYMASGVYGRSDSPEGFGVYSDGNAKIDGDLHVTGDMVMEPPRTSYISLSAAAFRPEKHDIQYQNQGYQYHRTNGDYQIDYSKEIIAGLNLPDRAVITRIIVHFYTIIELFRLPSNAEFNFALCRHAFTGTSDVITTVGNSDIQQTIPMNSIGHIEKAVTTNPVQNNVYEYYIKVATYREMEVLGVTLEYTL